MSDEESTNLRPNTRMRTVDGVNHRSRTDTVDAEVEPCPGPGNRDRSGLKHWPINHKPDRFEICKEHERRKAEDFKPAASVCEPPAPKLDLDPLFNQAEDVIKYGNKVLYERENSYGKPAVNLGCAAQLIDTYYRFLTQKQALRGDDFTKIGPEDVAIMMCLVKIARHATGLEYVEDTLKDLTGYAEIAEKVAYKGE